MVYSGEDEGSNPSEGLGKRKLAELYLGGDAQPDGRLDVVMEATKIQCRFESDLHYWREGGSSCQICQEAGGSHRKASSSALQSSCAAMAQ